MPHYYLKLAMEILADSPEHAATIGRDRMLDPMEPLVFDIHPTEYEDPPDEWLPIMHRGWNALYCGNHPAVRPCQFIEWYTPKREEIE